MPEGKFCNRRPINTEEDLKALLGDKGGQQYYKEMEMLEVDTVALWETLQKTCKSRTRTWLEICAHCGLCANSCFLYTANNRDPKQVPSYKIQSTLGEMLRRKGQVDTKFMIDTMEVAWAKCTCCNRCGTYCPHGIDMGVMFSYLRGVLYSQGFVPWELQDRCGYAPRIRRPDGRDHRRLGGHLRNGWPRKTRKSGRASRSRSTRKTAMSCTS